jgi:hypothetical protein
MTSVPTFAIRRPFSVLGATAGRRSVAGIPFDLGTSNRPGRGSGPPRSAGRAACWSTAIIHLVRDGRLDLADIGDYHRARRHPGTLANIEAQAARSNTSSRSAATTITLALLRAGAQSASVGAFRRSCRHLAGASADLDSGRRFITRSGRASSTLIGRSDRHPLPLHRNIFDWTVGGADRHGRGCPRSGPQAVAEQIRAVVKIRGLSEL